MTQRQWSGHVFIGMSVDGMIARADDSLDWLTGDAASGEANDPDASGFTEFMASVDHLVMGRSTYEVVQGMGEWFYGDTPVIVLSTTLQTDDARIRIVRSLDEATELLDDDGARNVYVDGGRTVRTFLAAGLIRTITLTRVPVLIGEGKPLFGALPADVRLQLDDVRALTGGAVQTRYTVL
ncbi:dihydrofolate reductase family protein [Arthrobacter tumbae]|uniref:dihydrofolate reductase family protein n=1 Tax=Arthrobacter tumbae TaxID=163874 RepID=UPI001958BED5|nr:dihydrofolate reductase family protein [Arthrobacter tumbae]MBM7781320.1 dihydrofolate reductase [Arthrobacter tumbae]